MSGPKRDRRDAGYHFRLRIREQGTVIAVSDGIAWIEGLPSAALDQLVTFDDGSGGQGMVFELDQGRAGVICLDDAQRISVGMRVTLGKPELAVPVGNALLGRVVDPLCRPLDDGAPPQCSDARAIDVRAPSIAERDFVHEPLYTGNSIVDTLLPVGRGQRQLLIGDRGLGKSALALDAVVNQKPEDVLCVYVLIGKRRSDVASIIETLRTSGALAHSAVVVAEAGAAPGLQYIAPYAGCAIAEHWMRAGRHVLIVYDDLTRHAHIYRTLSLLLRRPPGREAYPGDIFFLHSRLLERATVLAPALGGGSLSALPIVETEEGDIAAYIPTNLISITDGQIVFSQALFSAGSFPAIDVTTSVSRVGGRAQSQSVRAEAGRIRLEYLQALELEKFARMGTRLDPATAAKVARGRILREICKQGRLCPRAVTTNLAWMIAFNDGLFDRCSPENVQSALTKLATAVENSGLNLLATRQEWSTMMRTVFA